MKFSHWLNEVVSRAPVFDRRKARFEAQCNMQNASTLWLS